MSKKCSRILDRLDRAKANTDHRRVPTKPKQFSWMPPPSPENRPSGTNSPGALLLLRTLRSCKLTLQLHLCPLTDTVPRERELALAITQLNLWSSSVSHWHILFIHLVRLTRVPNDDCTVIHKTPRYSNMGL